MTEHLFFFCLFLILLKGDLLSLYATDDLSSGVLSDDILLVQLQEWLGSILASLSEQAGDSTRVQVAPVGQVKDNTLDSDPQIVLGVVLGNLLEGELLIGDVEGGWGALLLRLGWGSG